MDILTGSLDNGAKEGGLIVTLGFQAKEHFLWIGAEPSGDTVSLEGSRPHREMEGPPTSLHQ